MAILVDHQPINWPEGQHTAETAVAGGQEIQVRLARKTSANPSYWDDAVWVDLDVSVSSNGGATWRDACGIEAGGGIVTDYKTGGEMQESRVTCTLPPGTNRVRAIVVITGGTLKSEITVESL